MNSPISSGSEIVLINDTNAAYHFSGNNLTIHTIALGNQTPQYVPDGSRILINSTVVEFDRPDGTDIPVDIEVGFNRITSNGFVDVSVPYGAMVTLTINGHNVSIDMTDTPRDISNKINGIYDLTAVKSIL